tara:strand:+ start:1300 stop:1755 length:456 start_codon:yes stop_codon:yes gene_type:complete
MTELPNEILDLIFINLPSRDIIGINKHYNNYKYNKMFNTFKNDELKWIIMSFPPLHIYYVNNDKRFPVFHISPYEQNEVKMSIDTYKKLKTYHVDSFTSCDEFYKKSLYIYELEPVNRQGKKLKDDTILSKHISGWHEPKYIIQSKQFYFQ